MTMPADESVEESLRRVLEESAVARPSDELERRMEKLFRGRRGWRMAVVPVCSFAAGVLVTASIAVGMWRAHGTEAAGSALVVASMPAVAAPEPKPEVVFVSEPHQSTVELTGTLNGMPVVVQRTRTQFTASAARSSSAASGNVLFTDSVSITPAYHY